MDELTAAGIPGVLVYIYGGDFAQETLTSGVADLDTQAQLRSITDFRYGRITNVFMAALTLALAKDALLELDDTLERWLPGLFPDGGSIRIRHLLNHTSGLYDFGTDPDFLAEIASDPEHDWTHDELLEYAILHPLNFRPGTRHEYSDTESIVVAEIVSAVTSNFWGDELYKRVPRISFSGPTLYSGRLLPHPFIHGYAAKRDGTVEDVSESINVSSISAAGAMVGSASELGIFMRVLLMGRLYGEDLQSEVMQTVDGNSDPPGPGENRAGLGIYSYTLPCGVVWGLTGVFPGYRNYAAARGDGSGSVVVMVNEHEAPATLNDLILRVQELATCRMLGL